MSAEAFMRAAEELPLAHLGGIVREGGVLVLAPHPDDESVGCGGLIAQLAAQGRLVRVAILSDGAGSHPNSRRYPAPALRALRREEAEEALRCLGGPPPVFLEWPDGAVPTTGAEFQAAVAQVAALAKDCGTLLATSELDPHVDHHSTSVIARTVASRLGLRLLFYPVWSWRYRHPEMLPIEPREVAGRPRGQRLDISLDLERKRQAVMAHRSQTTRLIDDDPGGFLLTPAMLDVFLRPFEVFLEESP